MARLRTADTGITGLPAPFLDPAADEWHDPERFAQFAEALDLDIRDPSDSLPAPCGRRRLALLTAWAQDNGYGSPLWPNRPDHHRLKEAGLIWLRNYGKCPHREAPPTPKRRRRKAPTR